MHHAYDIVERFAIDRQARMGFGVDQADKVLQRRTDLDRTDVDPRDHDVPGGQAAQIENVLDKGAARRDRSMRPFPHVLRLILQTCREAQIRRFSRPSAIGTSPKRRRCAATRRFLTLRTATKSSSYCRSCRRLDRCGGVRVRDAQCRKSLDFQGFHRRRFGCRTDDRVPADAACRERKDAGSDRPAVCAVHVIPAQAFRLPGSHRPASAARRAHPCLPPGTTRRWSVGSDRDNGHSATAATHRPRARC